MSRNGVDVLGDVTLRMFRWFTLHVSVLIPFSRTSPVRGEIHERTILMAPMPGTKMKPEESHRGC